MTIDTYKKITEPFCGHPQRIKALNYLNKLLTLLVYCAYPVLLLILVLQQDVRLMRVLLTPAVSFVLVSIFRRFVNAPRPYEALDIDPLIKKDTRGESFPSRHVFSVFVIAMAFLSISLPLGLFLLIIGVLIAVIRVIGGVHFPKDVIVGAMIGIVSGLIGLYLLR